MIVIIGYLAACLTTASVVPQIIHTLRTRDVRGISIPSWAALSVGISLWLIYGLYIGSGPVIISNAVSLGLDITILTMAIMWRVKKTI